MMTYCRRFPPPLPKNVSSQEEETKTLHLALKTVLGLDLAPAKAEAPKVEVPKVEVSKAKVEVPKVEVPHRAKAEAPKAKAEAPPLKAEAPKAKAEAPKAKVEVPKTKVEVPKAKAEAPKAEAPKAEASKVDAPKAKAEAPKAPAYRFTQDDVDRAILSVHGMFIRHGVHAIPAAGTAIQYRFGRPGHRMTVTVPMADSMWASYFGNLLESTDLCWIYTCDTYRQRLAGAGAIPTVREYGRRLWGALTCEEKASFLEWYEEMMKTILSSC